MPETAPDINYLFPATEHKIGFAWQVRNVQAVAEAHRIYEPAYYDLRLRALRPDATHILRAAFGRERISQTTRSGGYR